MMDANLRAFVLAQNAAGQGFSRFVAEQGGKSTKCTTVSHATVAVICCSLRREGQAPTRFASWTELTSVSLALKEPSELAVRKVVPPPRCRRHQAAFPKPSLCVSQRQGFCYSHDVRKAKSQDLLYPDVSRDFSLSLRGVEISEEGETKFLASLDKGVKTLKNCAVGKLKSLAEANKWDKDVQWSVYQWFVDLYREFELGSSSKKCGCKTATGRARELGKCNSCLAKQAFSQTGTTVPLGQAGGIGGKSQARLS